MTSNKSIFMLVDASGNVLRGRWARDEAAALAGLPAGTTAHRTSWRRMPALLSGPRGSGEVGAQIVGGAVEFGGLRFVLSDTGRPLGTGMEPLDPDAEITDPDALSALAAQIGRPVVLVERLTQRRVVALHERPAGKADAQIATGHAGADVIVAGDGGQPASRVRAGSRT